MPLKSQRINNDGNKRTTWLACATFLEMNGQDVMASQEAVANIMVQVADGSATEQQFVDWLERQNASGKMQAMMHKAVFGAGAAKALKLSTTR